MCPPSRRACGAPGKIGGKLEESDSWARIKAGMRCNLGKDCAPTYVHVGRDDATRDVRRARRPDSLSPLRGERVVVRGRARLGPEPRRSDSRRRPLTPTLSPYFTRSDRAHAPSWPAKAAACAG